MTDPNCPVCGIRGRKISSVTIERLAEPEALTALETTAGFAYCSAAGCEVVWFQPESGVILDKESCRVRVGMKEAGPPRPVCYCFEHTIEEIETAIKNGGSTNIPADIAAKCKQGLDRCEETNPQGSCCLGNINKIVKTVTPHQTNSPFTTLDEDMDCCGPNSGVCDLDK